MLRLRRSILVGFLSSPSTSPIAYLHRLLSAAALAVPSAPRFAVEDYLIRTCGLTRAQSLKASAKISHLKSPSKPDAVLAFLAGLGLSSADISAVVAKDPQFLCAKVDKTLTSNFVGLTDLGMPRSEVARLVSLAPANFRCRSIVSNLPYYLWFFGSYEKLFRALKKTYGLLGYDLDKAVKPNVAFLQECGIDACGIASMCLAAPWLLGSKPEQVREMVARAEALGVPRGSRMFRFALQAIASRSEENVAVKVEHLKNMLRSSDAEVGIAVCKFPMMLTLSKENLQRKSEFFMSDVGLEPAYILQRPSIVPMRRSWRSSYALTRKPHRTLLKTMQQLAKGKCRLDSDLHEPIAGMKFGNCVWHTKDLALSCKLLIHVSLFLPDNVFVVFRSMSLACYFHHC